MVDVFLLLFSIVLFIVLYGILISYRHRSRQDRHVYYTVENTRAGEES